MRSFSDQLTPREYEEYNQQKEMWQLGADHAKEMKQLDIEVMKLEAKWSSWMRIPLKIVLLPVYILFGIAFCIAQITKKDMPDEFWDWLTK
jgi:hypothetical protein